MPNRPVALLDSGIGGLPYCAAFRSAAPGADVVYVADRLNFPYGPKGREELSRLLVELVGRMRAELDPRMVIVACNTASVSSLAALRDAFPGLDFVGTVPAVKPAALASRSGRIGVLATERTVEDPYVAELVRRFAPGCSLVPIAAPELVDFVERRYAFSTEAERAAIAASYVDRFRSAGADALVLGCTHFLFLAPEFEAACGKDVALFDSRAGVANRAASILAKEEDRDPSVPAEARKGTGRFYVTGNPDPGAGLEAFAAMFDLEYSGGLDGAA